MPKDKKINVKEINNEKSEEVSKKVITDKAKQVITNKINDVSVVNVKIKNITKSNSKDEMVENRKVVSKKKNKSSRPQTAYNIFMKIKMTEIEAPNQTEKLKLIAKYWKELSDKDKKIYHEEADLKKKEFNEQKEILQNQNGKKKRLPNAYNIFLKERMQTIDGENQKDKLIKIAFEWKNLNKENRSQFIEKAFKLKEAQISLS